MEFPRSTRRTQPTVITAIAQTKPKQVLGTQNSLEESLDLDAVSARRSSHAQASTSAALPGQPSRRPSRHAGRVKNSTDESGAALPQFQKPPHLQLTGPPRAGAARVRSEHVSPPPLAGPAGGQVFPTSRAHAACETARQASATSRIAVLGRALLQLPPGASPGAVLQGEMLSSKQITWCAWLPCHMPCFAQSSHPKSLKSMQHEHT